MKEQARSEVLAMGESHWEFGEGAIGDIQGLEPLALHDRIWEIIEGRIT